jgi:hypothetical protein
MDTTQSALPYLFGFLLMQSNALEIEILSEEAFSPFEHEAGRLLAWERLDDTDTSFVS